MADVKVPGGGKSLEWVRVSEMRISPKAQRGHNKPGAQALIEEIVSNFDPDKLGALTVSEREGTFWVVDGGHRWNALMKMGYEDQLIQCWTYHGLSEKQEADLFLDLNNVRVVSGMDKFKVAVVAGRSTECQIDAIARAEGLSIGTYRGETSIQCVGALTKVYENGGTKVLERTLQIIRDAYGKAGFSARVVEGIGMFVATYENSFDQAQLVSKLSQKLGGVSGLINQAQVTRATYGVSAAVAVAATVVDTYNSGRGGVKLPGWWQKVGKE
jgi:hypothetical protein